jgi:uncharacterized protein (TIGR00297 family)
MLTLVLFIGLFSYKRGFLDRKGTVAGLAVGLTILTFGGWKYLAAVLTFFAASLLVTKLRDEEKREKSIIEWKLKRSWNNVLANGAPLATIAFIEWLTPHQTFTFAFMGALSTAMADTMATELGLLNPGEPRLSTNWGKRVPPGTSGAISPLGLVAAFLGAFTMGLTVWVMDAGTLPPIHVVVLIASIAGTIGSFVDSLLGATLQGVYRCEACTKMVEENRHCGRASTKIKGYEVVNNDIVNLFALGSGALVAMILSLIIQGNFFVIKF